MLRFSGAGYHRTTILGDSIAFSRFNALTVLDLSESSANDDCMKVLGFSCPQLTYAVFHCCSKFQFKNIFKKVFLFYYRALSVTRTDVSDAGVQWLFGSNDSNAANIYHNGCQLLVSLFVRYSNVTVLGVRLAMVMLKKLQFVDFENTLPLVNGVTLPPCFLIGFSCYKGGTVHLKNKLFLTPAVEIVHHVMELKLSNRHLADAVDTMSYFDTTDGEDGALSFGEGLVPFLLRFGGFLKVISLTSFDLVDVFFILRSCPRLYALTVECSAGYISSFPHPQISLVLERFNYKGLGGACIESVEIQYLLSSPNLKHVEICDCSNLIDSVIQTAFEIHEFAKLEKLVLRKCNNLSTGAFVRVFLSRANSLKVILLDRCKHLCTTRNQSEWSALKIRHNWDLNFKMQTRESERTLQL